MPHFLKPKKQFLVFLHVEKAAGTSFRTKLYEMYGRDKVFWFGIDNKAVKLDEEEVRERDPLIIGGHHWNFSTYAQKPDYFYFMSLLRNPVDRVLSLYNYFLKNNEKEKLITELKVDPFSLTNTLKQSQVFIDQIWNRQCYYLSGTRSASQTIENLSRHPFLVGTQENLSEYINHCAKLFGWNDICMPYSNVGESNYQRKLSLETEALNIIQEYVAEDVQLYQYVQSQGVVFNPSLWKNIKKFRVALSKDTDALTIGDRKMVGLELLGSKTFTVTISEEKNSKTGISLPIKITNNSNKIIHTTEKHTYTIGYILYKNGRKDAYHAPRTALTQNIAPGEALNLVVDFVLPQNKGEYTVEISIIQENVAWFVDENPQHGQRFQLVVQ